MSMYVNVLSSNCMQLCIFFCHLVKVTWAQMLATCFANQQRSHTPVLLHRHAIIALSLVLYLFLWVGVMSATSRFRPAAVLRPINRLLPHKLTWRFNGDLNVTSQVIAPDGLQCKYLSWLVCHKILRETKYSNSSISHRKMCALVHIKVFWRFS